MPKMQNYNYNLIEWAENANPSNAFKSSNLDWTEAGGKTHLIDEMYSCMTYIDLEANKPAPKYDDFDKRCPNCNSGLYGISMNNSFTINNSKGLGKKYYKHTCHGCKTEWFLVDLPLKPREDSHVRWLPQIPEKVDENTYQFDSSVDDVFPGKCTRWTVYPDKGKPWSVYPDKCRQWIVYPGKFEEEHVHMYRFSKESDNDNASLVVGSSFPSTKAQSTKDEKSTKPCWLISFFQKLWKK
jgi:hypothetical protein